MTTLDQWLTEGLDVQISDQVEPGSVFVSGNLRVVHPFDYTYIAYDDIFEAHRINMSHISHWLDMRCQDAEDRLDDMVYDMNRKHDPRVILFDPGVEAVEQEDGSFEFVNYDDTLVVSDGRPSMLANEFLKGIPDAEIPQI